jgi:hypothetical protein
MPMGHKPWTKGQVCSPMVRLVAAGTSRTGAAAPDTDPVRMDPWWYLEARARRRGHRVPLVNAVAAHTGPPERAVESNAGGRISRPLLI